MKLSKCLRHSIKMVVHSKLRSWLTIIGIVIGVGAVVAIVSLGEGLQQSVNQNLGNLGGDILTITAGFSRGGNIFGGRGGMEGMGGGGAQVAGNNPTLGRPDVQSLRAVPQVALINAQIRGSANVSYLGKSGTVSLIGVDQSTWSQVTTSQISTGRMLDAADQNVVVVGGRLASSYFSQPLGINKMIIIGGSAFRIVGILNDQSTNIYMPIQLAYKVIKDKTPGVYDSIVIKVKDESLLNDTINQITNRLIASRHVNNKTMDFSVTSNLQIQETRQQALSTITTFLTAIAAVSLIVGAIGIANTMFTSVLEKTKEIGIMKAIGATNKDILLIFLIKAGIIGFIGGLLGVFLGAILSGSMTSLIGGGMPFARGGAIAVVSLNAVLMALSVSSGAGIIAGMVPAYQASKLKPVDALRYE